MKRRKLFPQIVFLSLVVVFLLPIPAVSQDFPKGSVTLYVGYAAGASTDITARALANAAEPILGVPIIVENKAGGSSSVAAGLLAAKKPDGYTLAVIGSSALNTVPIMTPRLSYNPLKDFTYFFSYGNYRAELAVQKQSPFKTLKELIEYAKNNPGKLSYATAGVGSSGHLFTEHVAKEAGVKFRHVPFKGGTSHYTALLGGHVDFLAGTGSDLKYVRQDLWRLLVIIHQDQRDPEFADVPTLTELGYKPLPGGLADLMLIGPKNMPDPIYKKLEAAFIKAAHSPEFQKTLKQCDMPFVLKDRRKLETEVPKDYKICEAFLTELGLAKK